MDTNCHADLRNYQDSFLDPLEDGCGERNQDLPASKLDAAKLLAKGFISELPTTTTIISTSPSKVTSKSLTVETRPSSSVQEGDIPDPTTTSTIDRNNQPDSTSTSNTIAASSAQTSIPSPDPSPEPIPPPLTDTSPFTNNNFVSSGSQARPPFRMLEFSLAAAVMWIGL
ncbi:hypothetical protein QC763_0015110 [Podospora pseudopauciseta]|uniref:Uncharacterized protein n=1 Tax=Podospora pseudopauciseta TaxID=2093780 RepID=A0ABR0HZZ8_9PEZI|nr:hypothetical protein QC763_0015110 [Podospora pseudopauciseta]